MIPQLPFDRPHRLAVPPLMHELQDRGVVHRVRTRVGHEAWLVTGYDEVRDLFSDERLGRSHPDPDKAARSGESAIFGGPIGNFATEREDHARQRALMQPQFSPKRMRAFQPRVAQLTADLLEVMAAGGPPADLQVALALPLPILVICELLGVPYEDRDRFRTWAEAVGDVGDRTRSERGLADLYEYGLGLIRRKRRHPGDDVISRLSMVADTTDEEVAMLAMGLLFAGHETTVVQIGLGVVSLLVTPDQWRALRDDPRLIPSAVEEIMRYPARGANGGIPRYAHTDLEVGGVTIRAGELVLLDNSAANHDPRVFIDPHRFDVDRHDGAHLTFGHGLRYCIGAPLARIELNSVLSHLIPRFPDMRLTVPVEKLPWRSQAITGGFTDIPVDW